MGASKVAVVHPLFGWGGSEAVAAWVLHSLQDEYRLTLLTFDQKINVERLNNFYGTRIDGEKVKIKRIQSLSFLNRNMSKFAVFRQHLMMRECKKLVRDFDLFFSTYNEMDFGKPGLQYVHFPFLANYEYLRLKEENFSRVWYHRPNLLRNVYLKIGELISNYDESKMLENLTLVNSRWTGEVFQKNYGVEVKVLYPPVYIPKKEELLARYPFDKRGSGFVCVGRIEPTKRILEIIDILGIVRKMGVKIHLHIAGRVGDQDYYKQIVDVAYKNSDWIFIHDNLDRLALAELLASHKYGIHARVNEHFGIVVGEMIALGLIPFVHKSGGQVEMVQSDILSFLDKEEAAEKIYSVISNPDVEHDLKEKLKDAAKELEIDNFVRKVKEYIREFLKNS